MLALRQASALLLDALVLYLKALSVVGTAIKALRQVIDVIQSHIPHLHIQQPPAPTCSQLLAGRSPGGPWRGAFSDDRKVGPSA